MTRRVLIGIITGEYARRADFYDYINLLEKPEGTLVTVCHDRSPAKGRNLIVEEAINRQCSHILFVDDDMAPRPDALNQLLEHDKNVVTGLYYSRAYPHQPLIFSKFQDDGGAHFINLIGNESRLLPIAACGLGFCLIKTSIFGGIIKPYFRLGELDVEQWCDDIGFFYRFYNKCYCDTECRVGHIGTMIIWPDKMPDGKWVTGYDTTGQILLRTPQIDISKKYEFQGV
jgi:hypothetical protein